MPVQCPLDHLHDQDQEVNNEVTELEHVQPQAVVSQEAVVVAIRISVWMKDFFH